MYAIGAKVIYKPREESAEVLLRYKAGKRVVYKIYIRGKNGGETIENVGEEEIIDYDKNL